MMGNTATQMCDAALRNALIGAGVGLTFGVVQQIYVSKKKQGAPCIAVSSTHIETDDELVHKLIEIQKLCATPETLQDYEQLVKTVDELVGYYLLAYDSTQKHQLKWQIKIHRCFAETKRILQQVAKKMRPQDDMQKEAFAALVTHCDDYVHNAMLQSPSTIAQSIYG